MTSASENGPGWRDAAVAHAARWLEYQHRHAQLPGLQFAISADGAIAAQGAFGSASLCSREPLTPSHLLRVASHSKPFTAAGIMKLLEAGALRLDDPAGAHVPGLHPDTAQATLRQLLSHTAGVTRDGPDAGQWELRRPFASDAELRQALAQAPVLSANARFKYSNHAYGLLGLTIEAATGERYADWVAREVVAAAGLQHTYPDAPVPADALLAHGHGHRSLLGEPFEVDTREPTGALAAATGFASTTGQLARFLAQLAPDAPRSILSAASRREMTRPHWRIPDLSGGMHYGLGVAQAGEGEWAWFGHSGVFPGSLSHTSVLPAHGIAVSIAINGVELWPNLLAQGVVAILRAHREGGAPSASTSAWCGRWWSPWAAFDLVPLHDKVLVTQPAQIDPMLDAVELAPAGVDHARIAKASGYASFGETARLERRSDGTPAALWLGGTRLLPEADMAEAVRQRFRVPPARA
jgi:CubicO group peptidase (beta-lactamase class C family)